MKLETFRQKLQAEFLDFEQDQVFEAEELCSQVAVVVVVVMVGGAEDGFAPEEFGGEVVDERLFFFVGKGGWVELGWVGMRGR